MIICFGIKRKDLAEVVNIQILPFAFLNSLTLIGTKYLWVFIPNFRW